MGIAEYVLLGLAAYWLWQRKGKVSETYRIWRKRRK